MRVLYLMLVLVFGAGVQAAEQPLSSTLEAYRVTVDEEGRERLVPVSEIAPGQTIEYRLIYENLSSGPISGLVVSVPVPRFTSYQGGTASATVDFELQVSIDSGVRFSPEPLMRRDADGEMEQVPPDKYSNLKWVSDDALSPGEIQTYTYRVVVSQ